jgi:hypothetical protein
MSKRVTQVWAAPAYWLVASAGAAVIISLSLSVILTPTNTGPVAQQQTTAVGPLTRTPVPSGAHKAQAEQHVMTASEPLGTKIQDRVTNALPETVLVENTPIANAPLQAYEPKPISAPKMIVPALVQERPREAQNSPSTMATKIAQAPLRPLQIASQQTAFTARPVAPPRPTTDQPPLARAVDTVVVTGHQQMAINMDGIGRGNSLTIQLPRPTRH